MRKRFSLLLSMLMMLCGTIGAADYDFHVGGIYYSIIYDGNGYPGNPTTNLRVVKGDEKYEGDITIPSSIIVNDIEYTVTEFDSDSFSACDGVTSVRIPDSATKIDAFCFYQCKNLKTVYMGKGLVDVGFDAFGYCEALERVEISDLAAWCGIAFHYNGSASGWSGPHANPLSYAGHLYLNGVEVVNLVIPEEVTSIHGDLNFFGCVGLKSVTFPDDCHVEYIGARTFQGCENIKTLKLNKHLKRIYECAFSGCKQIESLVIPDEVTLISTGAFFGCSNLKELTLGNALEAIETGFWGPAFGETSITEITVPEKITNLNGFLNSQVSIVNIGKTSLTDISGTGKDAFLPIDRINITNLATFMGIKKQLAGYDLYLNGNLVEDLTIPSSTSEVGERGMQGCKSLKSITIPSHVEAIQDNAFDGCTEVNSVKSYIQEPFAINGNVFTAEVKQNATLLVPYGTKAKYQAADGWKDFVNIEEMGPQSGDDDLITFEDYYVEQLCLYYWDTNKDGHLSKQKAAAVTSLGDVFCLDLKKKKSWQTDGEPIDGLMHGNFSSFDELQYFTGLTTLDDGAFHSQLSLVSITLPANLKTIGKEAFYGCKYLAEIVVPDAVETISENAFAYCTNLATVTLGSSVKTIGNSAFCKTGIYRITIPEGCVTIGNQAFYNCETLSKVSIPATVTSIGSWAFGYVANPLAIHVADVDAWQKTSISCLDDEDPEEEGLLSTHASYRLYKDNQEVTSIMVPQSVTAIGNIMMGCTSLTSLTLHKDVTEMTACAFNGCSKLSSVTSYIESPFYIADAVFESWNQTASEDQFTTATLYVPAGSKSLYQAQYGWKKFATIKEMEDAPTQAEPYVVYNDGTLTFYYDNQRSNRPGTTYDLNEEAKRPGWLDYSSMISKVIFDETFAETRPITMYRWFNNCNVLTEIQALDNLNTIDVKDFCATFSGCVSLTSIDLSHFNTSNSWDFEQMFEGCRNLTSLDLSHFNTDNITNMDRMFNGCNNLEQIDISSFNTSKVRYMTSMFKNCYSLKNIDVSHFRSDGLIAMGDMFYGCSSVTSIDLSGFDTRNAMTEYNLQWSNMSSIFKGCSSLSTVTFSNNFVTCDEQYLEEVFSGCNSLRTITYTGDIPASINSQFFAGVGTAEVPAALVVPEQYKTNYEAKFAEGKFYGGYFTLSSGETPELKDGDVFTATTKWGVEMTFKVISAKEKTCQVGSGEENASAVDKDYNGTVTIPDEINGFTVTEIASNAFVDCNFLLLEFPAELTTIHAEALLRCRSLKHIIIPRTVRIIPSTAIVSCTGVETIMVEVENEWYDSRENCNAIIRKEDNTLIRGCKNTVIPSSVEKIAFAAFQWTPFGGEFVVPEGVKEIGQSAFVSTTMSSISLPSTLTHIGGWSFQDCDGLTAINIPENVTFIGNYAFSFCDNVSEITIPASVTEIGEKAFYEMSGLVSVVSLSQNPTALRDDVFTCYSTATLTVPNGTKETYEATDGWKNFSNIVEADLVPDDTFVKGDANNDGSVDIADAVCIVNYVVGKLNTNFVPEAADVNGDGDVDIADAVHIVNYVVGKINALAPKFDGNLPEPQ
jgi:surface protein